MKPYSELIEMSKNFGLRYSLQTIGDFDFLKLSNHWHPFSMNEREAKSIYNYIIENNLKYGFEVATAFGVSASVIGQALKITGGKLVTMDSYIEEHFGNSSEYDSSDRPKLKPEESDCYRMATKLIEGLELQDTVKLEIGWSPEDNSHIIKKHFDKKLDFCFIDGGHTAEQIDKDVMSLMEHLSEKCVLFFHDYQCMGEKTIRFLKDVGFGEGKLLETTFDLVIHRR